MSKPDERLRVGAYVRRGTSLYRVAYCQSTDVVIEDALESNASKCSTTAITVRDLLSDYSLVRSAAVERF